jgi:hypothetical protein
MLFLSFDGYFVFTGLARWGYQKFTIRNPQEGYDTHLGAFYPKRMISNPPAGLCQV